MLESCFEEFKKSWVSMSSSSIIRPDMWEKVIYCSAKDYLCLSNFAVALILIEMRQ